MISVLVADDSAFMRVTISTLLEKADNIKVVATARDGVEALELIAKHNPDIVTLDVNMPRMDGLATLREIMSKMPRPVLMVSSLTADGAETTLKALEYGAADYIVKKMVGSSLDMGFLEKDLADRVQSLYRRRHFFLSRKAGSLADSQSKGFTPQGQNPVAGRAASAYPVLPLPAGKAAVRNIVAIGVSTGGPPAVQRILASIPANFPAAILIAQHMPAAFTGAFAKRLDSISPLNVVEARGGEIVTQGTVYIGPGGKHISMRQVKSQLEVVISPEPADALYKPSANVLISSCANVLGKKTLGVILTGMGYDGKEGIKDLKEKGGRALAQSEATCVVYGMPKAIVDAGFADEIVDLEDMAGAIIASIYK